LLIAGELDANIYNLLYKMGLVSAASAMWEKLLRLPYYFWLLSLLPMLRIKKVNSSNASSGQT